jgi:leader peptidase (prepilin peptidase)/N-methyltransferase
MAMTSALDLILGPRQLQARYDLRGREVLACFGCGVALTAVLSLAAPAFAAAAAGYLLFTMLLVVLIDSRRFIIPDVLSLPAIPAGLAAAVSVFAGSVEEILLDHGVAAVAASGSLWAIRTAYRRLRGVEGLGLGDVKLAAAAGAWLGLGALPMTCLVASAAALAAVLLRRAIGKEPEAGMMTAVPFGSFMAPAIVVMWLVRLLTD